MDEEPKKPKLICVWRGRIVLHAFPGDTQWFTSDSQAFTPPPEDEEPDEPFIISGD